MGIKPLTLYLPRGIVQKSDLFITHPVTDHSYQLTSDQKCFQKIFQIFEICDRRKTSSGVRLTRVNAMRETKGTATSRKMSENPLWDSLFSQKSRKQVLSAEYGSDIKIGPNGLKTAWNNQDTRIGLFPARATSDVIPRPGRFPKIPFRVHRPQTVQCSSVSVEFSMRQPSYRTPLSILLREEKYPGEERKNGENMKMRKTCKGFSIQRTPIL